MRNLCGVAVALSLLVSCQGDKSKDTTDFLTQNMDTTADPGKDFFQYANGGWVKKTPIPEEESGWGIGQLVQQDIYLRLRTISEEAAKKAAAPHTVSQQIGDLWYSGMDSAAIEKAGLGPLRGDLDAIEAIKTVPDLLHLTAALHKKGVDILFGDGVAQDDKNSDSMRYQFYQGGLGMPNRDYYFNTAEKPAAVRTAYQHYLITVFQQLGKDSASATKAASEVFKLETRLAAASRKLADLRDPEKNYNKMSRAGFQQLTPAISWDVWTKDIGAGQVDTVIVRQPEFYTLLNKELKTTSLDNWKLYVQARLIESSAAYLDSTTFNNLFAYTKTLSGALKPRPRWKRVLDAEDEAMGEALGQLFVKEYFPEKAKQRYSDLVESVRDAYKDRIQKLTWMSDSTRTKAISKLSHITKKVGYPDKWKDFSALRIDRGPFVLNMQRASEWWSNFMFAKLGKPVDRSEWDMSPQTYNAYYNPSNNEIVLPAGIFAVPGKKDEELDDAFIYGYAAASTIGHEITHGFDDQGRQFDEKGNLHNWWQSSDSAQFVQRAANIVKQFSNFNPVDTLHVNGDATQGENIADLGGLLLGLDAFYKTDFYKKGTVVGGLTPLQRYFVGYAYAWLYQERKEALVRAILTDFHAPARERVNGPMVNIPAFYDAFRLKPQPPAVSIW